MTDLISAAARSHSNALAFDDGTRQVTYTDLQTHLTEQSGVGQGEHVIWCSKNDWKSFLTFWKLQSAGSVACPISERFPEEKRNAIAKQLDAQWLSKYSHDSRASESPYQADPESPATITLSSGSTGTPKAIVHSMAAHIASATGAATNIPLGPGDRWLWSLPLYHVSGLSILVRCAVAGATVVGIHETEQLSAELLRKRRITHLSVVSTQLKRLLASKQFPGPELKSVLLGGSSVQPKLVTQARERGVAVHTTYGLTEMASQVTTSTSECDPTTSGRVLPGCELVVDDGEILVRGETLCLGYYRDGEIQTAVDDDGWFHTRDRGSLNAKGQLTVAGRIDNMFISGGENIYPESIERALLGLFEIEPAIVVPKPDEEFGARPVAFVRGELPLDWESQLRNSLRGFEVPTQILDWPTHAELGIKPDRKKLCKIVGDTLPPGESGSQARRG